MYTCDCDQENLHEVPERQTRNLLHTTIRSVHRFFSLLLSLVASGAFCEMIPPVKARRTQEDGFDRGRKPAMWWFTMTMPTSLGILLLGLLVAPHTSTPQVDHSSPNLQLQHAGAIEHKAGAPMAGAVEGLSSSTLAYLAGGTAGGDGLTGGRLEDSSGHPGPETCGRVAGYIGHAGGSGDADTAAGDPSTTSQVPHPNLHGRQATAQALVFRSLFGSRRDEDRGSHLAVGGGADTRRDYAGCPFANNPESAEAHAYWYGVLEGGVIAFGLQDTAMHTTRNVYDALDAFGSVLACCPGLLSARDSGSQVSPSLPSSCGLLDATGVFDGSSAAATGERSEGGSNVGYELVAVFSSALRAARLPSVALQVLHDANAFNLTTTQRATWDRETAMVLLQMGRTGEATARLTSAVALNGGDLRALQPLGSALVAQGSVVEGACARACDMANYDMYNCEQGIRDGLTILFCLVRGRRTFHTNDGHRGLGVSSCVATPLPLQ